MKRKNYSNIEKFREISFYTGKTKLWTSAIML